MLKKSHLEKLVSLVKWRRGFTHLTCKIFLGGISFMLTEFLLWFHENEIFKRGRVCAKLLKLKLELDYFIEMQLIYLIDIFEDNYNIARDCFETDSVNVMKNRPLVPKKQRKFQYILACLSLSENHENCH